MKHIRPYGVLESVDPDLDGFWLAVDRAADRIGKEGYGRPIRDLIAERPEFGIVKFGKQLCDPDVLFDRWHKLKQKNQVMRNVSIGERIAMLLMSWDGLGRGLNHLYNPKKLPFSRWYTEPQTLYRGVPAGEEADRILEDGRMDGRDFYSFTLDPEMAELFTIPGYASGGFVRRVHRRGYVFSTTVAPADFHIFMGGMLDDELEVILGRPIDVQLFREVGRLDESSGSDAVRRAAQAAGYTIGPVYHGTDERFTEFDPEKSDFYFRNQPMKYHFAYKREMAERGGKPIGPQKKYVMEVFIKGEVDGTYDDDDRLVPSDADHVDIPGLMVTVRNPWQIKLADPITYDDNGRPIPLSKRFDSNNNDIRY